MRTGDFDGGWTIEMAIPFKSLRYEPGREQTWGINLRRVVRWKNEWSYLAQVPRALTTFRGILKVSSAGTLDGLEAPSGSRNVEIKPYALGGAHHRSHRAAAAVNGDADARVGGDVKYGLTQNLTADLTVNTDFAQVEVDEQQVNLTRFNLFFPEKRDFFLEGAGHVRVRRPRQRRPGGRQRRHAVPVLQPPHRPRRRPRGPAAGRRPRDRQGRRRHRRRAQRADRRRRRRRRRSRANFTVLRAKRDILRRSSVGGMFTHRTATPGPRRRERRLRRRRQLRLLPERAARRLRRRARGARAATGDDLSYRGFFDYNADRYGFQAERLEVQPNFLPEIGFLRRTDFRRNFGLAALQPAARRASRTSARSRRRPA